MHWPGEIFQQELHGEDVEEHPKRPADSIMRIARHSRRILNGYFRDPRSIEAGQRRNETVELTVEIDVFENLGAVRLEGCAEIPQLDSGSFGHQPIGDAGRNFAR